MKRLLRQQKQLCSKSPKIVPPDSANLVGSYKSNINIHKPTKQTIFHINYDILNKYQNVKALIQ